MAIIPIPGGLDDLDGFENDFIPPPSPPPVSEIPFLPDFSEFVDDVTRGIAGAINARLAAFGNITDVV